MIKYNNCSEDVKYLIDRLLMSDNEMFFVEYEDMDLFTVFKIYEEVQKSILREYILFYEDAAYISVYGGLADIIEF